MEHIKKNLPLVLVIDDDEVNRIVLKRLFEKQNIMTCLAETGSQGIAMAKIEKPDIILLDIIMPDENGFEVLSKLKTDPTLMDIPVCIFSILEDKERIKKAYAMGACSYISKPFDIRETVDRVKEILNSHPEQSLEKG